MRKIKVALESDENDVPAFYVADDKSVKFPFNATTAAGWRDPDGIADAAVKQAQKGQEVVELQDGSDSYVFASMADAVPC